MQTEMWQLGLKLDIKRHLLEHLWGILNSMREIDVFGLQAWDSRIMCESWQVYSLFVLCWKKKMFSIACPSTNLSLRM